MKVPRGSTLDCRGWPQEGILRLLLNCLDEEVAERPDELVVYGTGRAVRSREALAVLLRALRELGDDETLLVQSGKPLAVLPSHPLAPRVLQATSLVVPHWCRADEFHHLEGRGLTMYGQTSAASWSYIGTQGVLEATLFTFMQLADIHFGGTLRGRLVLTSGLGGLGRSQPVAVRAVGGVALVVEADPERVAESVRRNACDISTDDLDRALLLAQDAVRQREPLAVALCGNAAEVYPELVRRGLTPDVVTDGTAAHDLLAGYLPAAMTPQQARELRRSSPDEYVRRAEASLRDHFEALLAFRDAGAIAFDHGNNIRGQAARIGIHKAFSIPGYVEAFLRPLLAAGRGSFRWVALSGEPEDIFVLDEVVERISRWEPTLRWIRYARSHVWFEGLPARVCWLDAEEREQLGREANRLVREGRLQAPVALTRDHLDSGSVASPYRETERMRDGSDAVADWPVLNALLCAASGAHLVALGQGGGVGVGYSVHSGFTLIADGSLDVEERIANVLTNDPRLGVARYRDAGYAAEADHGA